MAEFTPISTQEASRITSHMNKEHAESLSHYLSFYGEIPASKAAVAPEIVSFTSEEMTIAYGKKGQRKEWKRAFEPQMGAGQARKRLEEMHREARAGLGISEVTINEFKLDPLASIIFSLLTGIELALLFTPPTLLSTFLTFPSTHLTPVLKFLGIAPTLFNLGIAIKVALVGTLWAMHLTEIYFVLWPLMRTYNMTSTTPRMLYIITVFFGGFSVWGDLKRKGERLEYELARKAASGKTH